MNMRILVWLGQDFMLVLLRFLLVMSPITDIYTTMRDVLPVVLTNDDQEITNFSPSYPTSGGI